MQTKILLRESGGYIARNIAASLGISLYVIIDTLFIATAAGADGLAALNIVLPVFNFISSVGLLLGIGGSTIFSINKVHAGTKVATLYGQLLLFGIFVGIIFSLLGNLATRPLLQLLGADQQTLGLASSYLRIVSLGASLFIANYITVNFVRNDGNPHLTMVATLAETTTVICLDYLFIFVFNWGMNGAAWATLFSPLVSLMILTRHRKFPLRQLQLHFTWPQWHLVWQAAQLGFASFLTEMSTGVGILVFNLVLEKIAGTYAIAAYGVIANIALVVLALFNGVALGIQPLMAREFGNRAWKNIKIILQTGIVVCIVLAIISYLCLVLFKYPIIEIFNIEHQLDLTNYAAAGIPLYFISIFFSGSNLCLMMWLVAINQPRYALFLSLNRGYIILLPAIYLLGMWYGLNGVWLSVVVSEGVVLLLGSFFAQRFLKNPLLN
ncbi:MAG: MATE family efflux transporter [Liquorilactobacillus ghanensis]|uniref:MATE family efflux transporter n=1 Tax=Liquorilactobacillus ghanensis TaxID=399370 RepID=UPI0039EAAF2A